MKLYHLSENGNIKKFIPRASKAIWNNKKYVWAISEDKIQNYLFPRECPRICISNTEASKLNKWISESDSLAYKSHIFVCEDWKSKIDTTTLYKYQFDHSNFREIDKTARYFVSEKTEVPIAKEVIQSCIPLLKNLKANLKFLTKSQMIALREDVIKDTSEFSIIKWGNS